MVSAISTVVDGGVRWEACNIESSVPFIEEDGPELRSDPLTVLDRYYPGAGDLLCGRGVERLAPITEYYPMERAADVLRFRPEHNFGQWLEELGARPEERVDRSPPWP